MRLGVCLHRFSSLPPMNLWYWSAFRLAALVGRVLFRFRVVHRERVIRDGAVIFAMNHESYLDPPLAGIATGREVAFLTRKNLLAVPVLGWLLSKLNVVPVDQEGNDRRALKALLRILKSGRATVVFPEGSRTLDGNLQPALPGLGFVIAKTLAPVVPMRIFGAREALPRGGGRLRLHPITIVVGEPLRFTPADLEPGGKDLYQRLSERVMTAIAELQIE